ncbi:MAG: hypothetical protein GXY03_09970 [Solirubrobacterales bacterium]|nr:hypothetical protein [Solirubrobacterales bacterium]
MGAVESALSVPDEGVERGSVGALGAVDELGVDVHRHLGVGVADLALDERHVEACGEQHDRDVGAPEGVRGDVRQRLMAALDQPGAGALGGRGDDPAADVAGVPAAAVAVAEEEVVGAAGVSGAELVGAVGEQDVAQDRGDLDVADSGRGLAVGDPQP